MVATDKVNQPGGVSNCAAGSHCPNRQSGSDDGSIRTIARACWTWRRG